MLHSLIHIAFEHRKFTIIFNNVEGLKNGQKNILHTAKGKGFI